MVTPDQQQPPTACRGGSSSPCCRWTGGGSLPHRRLSPCRPTSSVRPPTPDTTRSGSCSRRRYGWLRSVGPTSGTLAVLGRPDGKIARAIAGGNLWLLYDGPELAATITVDTDAIPTSDPRPSWPNRPCTSASSRSTEVARPGTRRPAADLVARPRPPVRARLGVDWTRGAPTTSSTTTTATAAGPTCVTSTSPTAAPAPSSSSPPRHAGRAGGPDRGKDQVQPSRTNACSVTVPVNERMAAGLRSGSSTPPRRQRGYPSGKVRAGTAAELRRIVEWAAAQGHRLPVRASPRADRTAADHLSQRAQLQRALSSTSWDWTGRLPCGGHFVYGLPRRTVMTRRSTRPSTATAPCGRENSGRRLAIAEESLTPATAWTTGPRSTPTGRRGAASRRPYCSPSTPWHPSRPDPSQHLIRHDPRPARISDTSDCT